MTCRYIHSSIYIESTLYVMVFHLFSTHRCGIALDCWMLPIHRDLCATGVRQPLLFINSKHHVLYRVKNLESMVKMEKSPDETGFSKCQILTLKYVLLLPRLAVSILAYSCLFVDKIQFKMHHQNTTACISHIDDHFKQGSSSHKETLEFIH